ncbi:VOC family protein [Miniimonas sp. S16]|uniref:VOC family protein n=1 Tax=Miniimonas sp. S16 TaxID=2171623 RepID=UPI001F318368|nr:VOC family protein [Miniimonas sp. S16]
MAMVDPGAPDGAFPRAITAVTLGVADVARSRAYYEALGCEPFEVHDEVVFIRLGGQILALFTAAGLAEDTGCDDLPAGSGSVTLARNFPSDADVDAAFARALAAGATSVVAPRSTSWGGYSSYVADPDGHLWELAWNPFWPIAADGTVGD